MIPQINLLAFGAPAANLPTTRPSKASNTFASAPLVGSQSPSMAVTVGQFMLASINLSATGTPPTVASITDSQGNVWTQIGRQQLTLIASNHHTAEVWQAFAKATGTNTLTISFSATPAHALSIFDTFDNVNPLQPWATPLTGSKNDSTSNIAPTGSINSTLPNSLAIALDISGNGNGSPSDGGWSIWGGIAGGSPQCCFTGYYKNIDVQNYVPTFGANSNWTVWQGALKGIGGTAPLPTAVLTTFDYASQGAAPAQLYDGIDSTPSADSRGLQTDTAAAFDYGGAILPSNCRIKVADTFGLSAAASFKIQWSDTSLSAGWTDIGVTISLGAGVSGIGNGSIANTVGHHRYWRIIYNSGSISSNAWLGELTFS
jgi:hypothetical protein